MGRWWPPASPEKRFWNETYLAGILILNLPASRTVRNKYLLLKPPNLQYFVWQTELTKTGCKHLLTLFSWVNP